MGRVCKRGLRDILAQFMTILALLLGLEATIPTLKAQNPADYPSDPPREFRGAWVASAYNLNWPSKAGMPPAEQRAELIKMLDACQKIGINAIIFQVRPNGDALYASKIEPWSAWLTGEMGKAPSPFYDPLQFAIDAAHARGIELHAWFNPFRAASSSKYEPAPNHVLKERPQSIREYGTYKWMDPSDPWVQQRALSVMMDVLDRYDVDGIHIDDYFYPYPVYQNKKIVEFPDHEGWAAYQASGGKLSRGEWRRSHVDRFVENLYNSIKLKKRHVKFGISPFGIWRPGIPETTTASLDPFEHLNADSRKWLREGWLDYFTPQLYWPISPPKQSFSTLYHWWLGENVKRRHLWPGISTERIGKDRDSREILNQIAITRTDLMPPPFYGVGHIHWDSKALIQDKGSIATQLKIQAYARPALPPASPWLGKVSRFLLTRPDGDIRREGKGVSLRFHVTDPKLLDFTRWWAVQVRESDGWHLHQVLPNLPNHRIEIKDISGIDRISVRPISLYGEAGDALVFSIPQ